MMTLSPVAAARCSAETLSLARWPLLSRWSFEAHIVAVAAMVSASFHRVAAPSGQQQQQTLPGAVGASRCAHRGTQGRPSAATSAPSAVCAPGRAVPFVRTLRTPTNSDTADTVVCSVSQGEHGNHTNPGVATFWCVPI